MTSPSLLQPLRSLEEACKARHARRGTVRDCAGCRLRDLCAPRTIDLRPAEFAATLEFDRVA